VHYAARNLQHEAAAESNHAYVDSVIAAIGLVRFAHAVGMCIIAMMHVRARTGIDSIKRNAKQLQTYLFYIL
jgi:hypothetical protein